MKAGVMRYTMFFCFCVAVLSLTGCAGMVDPFQRQGTWSATGAVNEDLAQQAANKSDLISGHGDEGSNGIAAVGAVEQADSNGTASKLETPPALTASVNISSQ
ncbi:hypothetical protein [Acidocella sp.]|uniref:hypothetical protein n=1 Tax=Acidocella sp. TaxID=50710 RepID=UPI002615C20F|nr:hypothetical protein [Acidocella sp.]